MHYTEKLTFFFSFFSLQEIQDLSMRATLLNAEHRYSEEPSTCNFLRFSIFLTFLYFSLSRARKLTRFSLQLPQERDALQQSSIPLIETNHIIPLTTKADISMFHCLYYLIQHTPHTLFVFYSLRFPTDYNFHTFPFLFVYFLYLFFVFFFPLFRFPPV